MPTSIGRGEKNGDAELGFRWSHLAFIFSRFCSTRAFLIVDVDLVKRLPKVLTIASIVVFAASLTQDAYYIQGEDPKAYSSAWMLVLIGWLGLLDGIFAWLANPVLLAAWIFSFAGRNKIALLLALLASVFMAAFLFRQTIIVSEAPTYAKITGYGAGYWLWLSSAIIATIGAAVGIVKR